MLQDNKTKAPPCPVCGRKASPETKPFCTPRCRDVDLNRWLSGTYAIAVEDGETRSALANDNDG
jgi:uncharacterized protein